MKTNINFVNTFINNEKLILISSIQIYYKIKNLKSIILICFMVNI